MEDGKWRRLAVGGIKEERNGREGAGGRKGERPCEIKTENYSGMTLKHMRGDKLYVQRIRSKGWVQKRMERKGMKGRKE